MAGALGRASSGLLSGLTRKLAIDDAVWGSASLLAEERRKRRRAGSGVVKNLVQLKALDSLGGCSGRLAMELMTIAKLLVHLALQDKEVCAN